MAKRDNTIYIHIKVVIGNGLISDQRLFLFGPCSVHLQQIPANMSDDEDGHVHRLAGSLGGKGGLVIMKKKPGEEDAMAPPKKSMLGMCL